MPKGDSHPPPLDVLGVSKRFQTGGQVLHEVSVSIRSGETVAVIGESGSGKTTLLRLLNRLEDPTEGEVRIHGRPALDLDPIRLRRNIGYVQQEGGLLPHWTVEWNIGLVPYLVGWPSDRRRARTEELLQLVALDPVHYRSRYPRELSGGQRQRVAFARALAADPEVILLDEPFGALDALTRMDLQDEFLRLKQRLNKTMVLVTHDLSEAFRLGDRIAVMRHGRIVQVGTPRELRDNQVDPYVRMLLARRPQVLMSDA